jgi:hypothetical protein
VRRKESIGKIVTKYEARKFLKISEEVLDENFLIRHQVEILNSKNSPATFGELDILWELREKLA